jgi:hypothetical protein
MPELIDVGSVVAPLVSGTDSYGYGASVIYKTKPEYEAAKAARKAAGKGKRKS